MNNDEFCIETDCLNASRVELRDQGGISFLIHWEGESSARPEGRWQLDNYVVYIPSIEKRSRDHELILLPKVEVDEDGTAVSPVFFSADNDDDLSNWKECLSDKMEMADRDEAEQKLSMVSGYRSMRVSASTSASTSAHGPAQQSPEDYDVMNVLGKGGFGKVLLVKKKDNANPQLMAMKMMDKAFIVQQQQQQ